MKKRCSTCGQQYPPSFITCTCGICGGLIENEDITSDTLRHNYKYKVMWEEWQKKINTAPPCPLKEEDWLITCAEFNSCALCGSDGELEKLLVVPTYLGGKLYTYNVIPACSECAKMYRNKTIANPIKTLFNLVGIPKSNIRKVFQYLDSILLHTVLELFDYENDSIEVIVTVTEDTSIKPFDGIYARRKFDSKNLFVQYYNKVVPIIKMKEVEGITWRIL